MQYTTVQVSADGLCVRAASVGYPQRGTTRTQTIGGMHLR